MTVTKPPSSAVELLDVKNSYYIGNYQQCINEAQKIQHKSPEIELEKNIFMYRSYLGQRKYRIVIDEITNDSPPELQGLKLLAEYLSTGSKDELEKFLQQYNQHENLNINLIAASFYLHENNLEKTYRYLHDADELESKIALIQLYLRMSRFDLARKELAKMQEKDEDAILTMLAQASIYIGEGKDKLQYAYYIIQEIMDKYGSTSKLLNMQASCYVGQQKLEAAETALHESMEKDNSNPDTLINLLVVSGRLNRSPEIANRYLTQLRDNFSTQFIKDFVNKEVEFDNLCREYEPPSA